MTPVINLFKVYNKQEYTFFSQLLIILCSAISIYIASLKGSEYVAVFLISLVNGLVNLFLGLKILKISGSSVKKCMTIIANKLVISIPIASAITIIKIFVKPITIYTIMMCVFLIALHFITLYRYSTFKIIK